MAIKKQDILVVGKGDVTSNSSSAQTFATNSVPVVWSILSTYASGNVVEYGSNVYRSNINGNLGNQPSTSPTQWEKLYNGVKDGDFAYLVNGQFSEFLKRANSLWLPVGANLTPTTVALNDNQAISTLAFSYVAALYSYANIEYTIRRGAGHSQKRAGNLKIVSDPLGTLNFSDELVELGVDVGVTFTVAVNGPNIEISYTSTNLGLSIELKYRILGWA